MSGDWREVARLLELAQAGGAAEALDTSERLLSARTGSVADGPAPLHFPRTIALLVSGDLPAALTACDAFVAAAEKDGSPAWRSIALSTRASVRQVYGEIDPDEHDFDAALRDVVEADMLLALEEPDPFVAANAHTGLAVAYDRWRLYELALPHMEAAYESSVRDTGTAGGTPAMWQCNLAGFHLRWTLELYRVGEEAEAERHSRTALRHARQAQEVATGPQAEAWRVDALFLAACARADGEDPAGVAEEIEAALALQQSREMFREPSLLAFLAVAYARTDRTEKGIDVLDSALASLPADTSWLARAALTHTRAVLLTLAGSADAAAALTYGNELATALWRQRERTLRNTQEQQRYEALRLEHEAVSRAMETDQLTGVANRRGFEHAKERLRSQPGLAQVGLLLIDVDKFKTVNDTLGHAAGDAVLRSIATTLVSHARDLDVVARLGGDEFAMLLPGADGVVAAGVAERARAAVDACQEHICTLSVGSASGAPEDLDVLLEAADRAMYVAKRSGGNAARQEADAAS